MSKRPGSHGQKGEFEVHIFEAVVLQPDRSVSWVRLD